MFRSESICFVLNIFQPNIHSLKFDEFAQNVALSFSFFMRSDDEC